MKLAGNNIRRHRWVAALTTTLMVASAVAALADSVDADGDTVTTETENIVIGGEDGLDCSVLGTAIPGSVKIVYNPAGGHYTAGEPLVVSSLIAPAGSGITSALVGTATVPNPWSTNGQHQASFPITTTVPDSLTTGSWTVTYTVSGVSSEFSRTADFTVSVDCPSAPAFTIDGFYQPVENAVVNGAKAGRVIPLKFNILDGDDVKQEDLGLVEVFVMKSSCQSGGTENDLLTTETLSSGKTELRWDSEGQQMIFNWKTPKTAGCYRILLEVDGDSLSVDFQLK